jgi:prepilin-type processing-associated H-X9-DG protein
LIELLVVVAIIALLIAILLPSLGLARAQAKAIACASNLHNVGAAMSLYLAQYRTYPPSYMYAGKPDPTAPGKAQYSFVSQTPSHPYGYVHWSYLVFSAGKVQDEFFQCPQMQNGGCPRTNPGSNPDNWENGQVDENGNGPSSSVIQDWQAPRMAYTGNAAIIVRNKFNSTVLPNAQCFNRLVVDSEIKVPGKTILATEFHRNWRTATAAAPDGTSLISKSHRPLMPFALLATSNPGTTGEGGEYDITKTMMMPFWYGDPKTNFGLQLTAWLDTIPNADQLIMGTKGSILDCVARHHPGGSPSLNTFSGTANFLYCDAHVERKNILDTLIGMEWGDRYYGLQGVETGIEGRAETALEKRQLGI